MIGLKELRELAETASNGRWKAGHSESGRPIVFDENMDRIAYSARIIGSYRRCENDTSYIAAANPQTIKALLDRIEAAEKVCDAAVSYCNPDDDDVCYLDFVEIVERWQQEVSQCADQQQKK